MGKRKPPKGPAGRKKGVPNRKPPKGRRWKKGQSGNPAGRKKGTPNKATLEIRALARALTTRNEKYLNALQKDLIARTCSPVVEVHILKLAEGNPVERVEVTGKDGDDLFPELPAAHLAELLERGARSLRDAAS